MHVVFFFNICGKGRIINPIRSVKFESDLQVVKVEIYIYKWLKIKWNANIFSYSGHNFQPTKLVKKFVFHSWYITIPVRRKW